MPENEQLDSNGTVGSGVSFRIFDPGDLSTCGRLAEDAWPAGPSIASKDFEQSGMKGYVEYSRNRSNWTDVAFTSDGIIGFLFGRIDGHLGEPAPREPSLGELPSAIRSFLVRGHITPSLLMFLWNLTMTEVKLKLKMPKSDASIEMLIVDSKHRGKGVGKALLERFLMAAEESGASLVTVYSDNWVSNWRFYERRGFTKVETFHDNITSHYSGSNAQGIIFALNLRER